MYSVVRPIWEIGHTRRPRPIIPMRGANCDSELGQGQLAVARAVRAASALVSARKASAVRYAASASSPWPRTKRRSFQSDVFSTNGGALAVVDGASSAASDVRSVAMRRTSAAFGGALFQSKADRAERTPRVSESDDIVKKQLKSVFFFNLRRVRWLSNLILGVCGYDAFRYR